MQIPVPKINSANITLRLLEPKDIPALKEAYYTNVPEFLPDDREIVDENLTENAPNYFVVEENGIVVAGGGIGLGKDGSRCGLYMGFVHRAHHRKGFGTLLMLARLAWTEGYPAQVWVMTHEKVRTFYQSFGFASCDAIPGIAPRPGFNIYCLQLDEQERAKIKAILAALPIRNLTTEPVEPDDEHNLHVVEVTGPRPDFRVFISLLYGDKRRVDTDGDSIPLHSRDWTYLYLSDRESDGPQVEIYADEGSTTFRVTSASLRLAELTAYYLYEYCGSSLHTKGKTLTEDQSATLAWAYQVELDRARVSIWHQSSDRNPYP